MDLGPGFSQQLYSGAVRASQTSTGGLLPPPPPDFRPLAAAQPTPDPTAAAFAPAAPAAPTASTAAAAAAVPSPPDVVDLTSDPEDDPLRAPSARPSPLRSTTTITQGSVTEEAAEDADLAAAIVASLGDAHEGGTVQPHGWGTWSACCRQTTRGRHGWRRSAEHRMQGRERQPAARTPTNGGFPGHVRRRWPALVPPPPSLLIRYAMSPKPYPPSCPGFPPSNGDHEPRRKLPLCSAYCRAYAQRHTVHYDHTKLSSDTITLLKFQQRSLCHGVSLSRSLGETESVFAPFSNGFDCRLWDKPHVFPGITLLTQCINLLSSRNFRCSPA